MEAVRPADDLVRAVPSLPGPAILRQAGRLPQPPNNAAPAQQQQRQQPAPAQQTAAPQQAPIPQPQQQAAQPPALQNPLNAPDQLDVQTVRPFWRRLLQSLSYVSQQQMVASRDHDFDQHIREIKDGFCQWLGDPNPRNRTQREIQVFIQHRDIDFTLVSVQRRGQNPRPYLCIRGLRTDDEVKTMHTWLSHRSIRDEYAGLGLCYDQETITPTTAHESVAVQYSSQLSLCGSIIESGSGPNQRTRTVACLIEVAPTGKDGERDIEASRFYALTGDHTFPPTSESSDSPEIDPFDPDDEDFDLDAEPALIVDQWQSNEQAHSVSDPKDPSGSVSAADPDSSMRQKARSDVARDYYDTEYKGREWCLVGITDPHSRLPNAIEDSARFQPDGSYPHDRKSLYNYQTGPELPSYVTGFASNPSDTDVVVVTGTSGILAGRLSRHDSTLHLSGAGFLTVWIVTLGRSLQRGDTGSLVVDLNTKTAYGHIIATTNSFAYILPLRQTIADIQSQLGSGVTVRLASSFQCLAEVSKSYLAELPHLSHAYALEAESRALLESSRTSGLPIALKAMLSQTRPMTVPTMCWMITVAGADLAKSFRDPAFWAIAQKEPSSKVDMSILRKMSSALSVAPPPQETSLDSGRPWGERRPSPPRRSRDDNSISAMPELPGFDVSLLVGERIMDDSGEDQMIAPRELPLQDLFARWSVPQPEGRYTRRTFLILVPWSVHGGLEVDGPPLARTKDGYETTDSPVLGWLAKTFHIPSTFLTRKAIYARLAKPPPIGQEFEYSYQFIHVRPSRPEEIDRRKKLRGRVSRYLSDTADISLPQSFSIFSLIRRSSGDSACAFLCFVPRPNYGSFETYTIEQQLIERLTNSTDFLPPVRSTIPNLMASFLDAYAVHLGHTIRRRQHELPTKRPAAMPYEVGFPGNLILSMSRKSMLRHFGAVQEALDELRYDAGEISSLASLLQNAAKEFRDLFEWQPDPIVFEPDWIEAAIASTEATREASEALATDVKRVSQMLREEREDRLLHSSRRVESGIAWLGTVLLPVFVATFFGMSFFDATFSSREVWVFFAAWIALAALLAAPGVVRLFVDLYLRGDPDMAWAVPRGRKELALPEEKSATPLYEFRELQA